MVNLYPLNSTQYAKMYPQNGDRIVTIDSVTSTHRMYYASVATDDRCCPQYCNCISCPYATRSRQQTNMYRVYVHVCICGYAREQTDRQTDRQTGLHTHRNTLLPQGTASAHRQLNWLVFTQMQACRQGRGALGAYTPPPK